MRSYVIRSSVITALVVLLAARTAGAQACVFVQGDATLPFYSTVSDVYTYPLLPNGSINYSLGPTMTSRSHYTPSLVVSVGVGWQRGRHR